MLDQKLLKAFETELKKNPTSVLSHEQLGKYFLKQGHTDFAAIQFHNVLTLQPNHAQAYFYLGIIACHHAQWDDAQHHFEQALKLTPHDTETLVNLGAIALKKNQATQAITYFTQALLQNPDHEAARSNLAATFMHFDRYENALTHYLLLLEKKPQTLEYLYHAAVCNMTLGQVIQAKAYFMKILHDYPHHFETLYHLGVLAMRSQAKQEARLWLEQALKENPTDASALHMYAALTGQTSSADITQQYTIRLFDSYALYYEQHMIHGLHYQLPASLAATLSQLTLPTSLTILDLGCGTGLAGEYLYPYSQRLIGVDLSKKMLQRAKDKGYYTDCIEADIVNYLSHTDLTFDLIVALDVLPYLSDLTACFKHVTTHLIQKGFFIFSIEMSQTQAFCLQETSRYAHHPDYISALCREVGIQIISYTLKPARSQNNETLYAGWYVTSM